MSRIVALVWLGLGIVIGATRSHAAEGVSADRQMSARLEAGLAELSALREQIADEKIPLSRELTNLESEILALRRDDEAARRQRDHQILEHTNVRKEIIRLEQEHAYLANLFGEYIRNFETRIHIGEMRIYEPLLQQAKTAHEQADLPASRRFIRQISLIDAALNRIEALQGGASFEGRATSEDGLVVPGRFLLIGPIAFFSSEDGSLAGIAEQRLGSLEPFVASLANPAQIEHIRASLSRGEGLLPFDLTGGKARQIEETRVTLLEHIRAGGAVMIPILIMAGLVFLLALFKALVMGFIRLPRPDRLKPLLDAVRRKDRNAARNAAAAVSGPAGALLRAGVEHLDGSKDLMEEAMYERMLEIRFRLLRGLPFIAVGAATAPLLGLLGTVTGIISTFKLITVFGSGDVRMLSSGISEALITTEFGLMTAIPALVIHAFLFRKAKAILDHLEYLGVMFIEAVLGSQSAPNEAQVPVGARKDYIS